MRQCGIFFLALLFAFPAQAEVSVLKRFIPVAFIQLKSDIPDDQAAVIVETLSTKISKTLLKVVATETIGSSADVTPKLDFSALGTLGYAMSEVDSSIESQVMPALRPTLLKFPSGQTLRFTVEILWAERAAAESLPQISFVKESVIDALRSGGRGDVANLAALRLVDSDTVDKDGSLRSRLRSNASLTALRAGTFNEWTPWDTTLHFEISRDGVELTSRALTLPARLEQFKPRKMPGVLIERVIYAPQMLADQELDLARIIVDRFYSTSGMANAGRARVSFGRWESGQFVPCVGESCVKYVNRMPTIHGVIQFAEHSWFQSVVGWVRSWFAQEVEVRILLKDLSLSYDRSTQQFSVVPAKSQIPIVITRVDAFGHESRHLVDDDTQVLGINFYEKYVGTQITTGLSGDLNKSISAADKGLSDMIGQMAGSILR